MAGQVGQELEDVLAERDALKVVNQELALKLTSADPQAGLGLPQEEPDALQVCARMRVLKCCITKAQFSFKTMLPSGASVHWDY